MSIASAIFRERQATTARILNAPFALPAAEPASKGEADGEASSLVRQVFSAAITGGRRRVFFAWIEPEPAITGFCERIGRALARVYGGSVVLVEHATLSGRDEPAPGLPTNRVEENLWRVSPETLPLRFPGTTHCHPEFPFDYAVCGASIHESVAPLLASWCDGAVLVLTANRTRRPAALRAREILASWNLQLLGAVLNHRTFPVPDAIYRRL